MILPYTYTHHQMIKIVIDALLDVQFCPSILINL